MESDKWIMCEDVSNVELFLSFGRRVTRLIVLVMIYERKCELFREGAFLYSVIIYRMHFAYFIYAKNISKYICSFIVTVEQILCLYIKLKRVQFDSNYLSF